LTLYADSEKNDQTVYVDHRLSAIGEANPPPAPAPAAASAPVPRDTFDVVASDDPGAGGTDPRDASTGPQTFSAEQLAAAKKARK